ncbi:MAG: hypothetical protein ACYCUI_07210 [Vulcanimicrobiaceae bacterium]
MADEMLPNAIFASMQKLMIGAAEAIEDIDPDGKIITTFIGQCRNAGVLAPIVDPTLYLSGGDALDALTQVAESALRLLQAKQRWQKASDAGRKQLERRTAGALAMRDLGLA